ncbi:MAG: hypothetical protein A2Y66_01980 [Nitrospirae bacterium RBG_13_41_22]|nr:MAG: hypothetical protein A2Y66_01980 [Nitrospirae bacterium RBG_13_41_22]
MLISRTGIYNDNANIKMQNDRLRNSKIFIFHLKIPQIPPCPPFLKGGVGGLLIFIILCVYFET